MGRLCPGRAWLDRAGIGEASEHRVQLASTRLLAPLTRSEFDRHLNKKAGMAAGMDGCTWDLLQSLSDDSKCRIFDILRNFMSQGFDADSQSWKAFPSWFRSSWMSVVPKKNADGTLARCRGTIECHKEKLENRPMCDLKKKWRPRNFAQCVT